MTLSVEHVRDLAKRTVERLGGDVEVLVTSGGQALTRFANGRINQNVAEDDTTVQIRTVVRGRQGGAGTNRLDDDSIVAAGKAAHDAAANAPADPTFKGLPGVVPWVACDHSRPSARGFGPTKRAEAVRALVTPSTERPGLTSAGKVEVVDTSVAIASSRGVDAYAATTEFAATVLSMGPGGGSGWAEFTGAGTEGFDPATLGLTAADLAVRSADAGALAPGEYTVVLGPEAVGEVLGMLAYTGLSAKSFAEGRSFLSGNLGETIMSESVSIVDDALADDALGLTFDYEGQPKRRVEFVKRGVANAVCTDSYWAAQLGVDDTGHALPGPNAFGPYPLDLRMEPGDATLEELIGDVVNGVYVARFWYVNVDDPVRVEMTGMTRDGTFVIENGKLTRPVRNLRFTQSAVAALGAVRGISKDRRYVGERGSVSLAPAMLLDKFSFTGQTE